MFSFAWPWIFLLLPLPALVYLKLQAVKKSEAALIVPFYRSLTALRQQPGVTNNSRKLPWLLMILIWLLLLASAAKPQWVGEPISFTESGRDLLLAVDISESMDQKDMSLNGELVSRLTLVKQVASEFIEKRKGDRLGLILFGTNAYLQVPLTFDTNTVAQLLDEAQLGFAGSNTAIGEAIGLAIKRLQLLEEKSSTDRVIILLTDGANTAGEIEPAQAAQLARQSNIKIYTIGIGAEEMIVQGFFGSRKINPSAQLDEVTLTAIADLTGGEYYRARNNEELEEIYSVIESLEPIEQEDTVYRPQKSLFFWPLALAFLISLAWAGTHLLHGLKNESVENNAERQT